MKPILLDLEPLLGIPIRIHAFGTFIVLAFLASVFTVRRLASRDLSLDKERIFNLGFALLFLGIAGARLLYVFVHYAEFSKQPLSFLYVWEGGLVFYGGLLAGLLFLAWYLPRHADLKGFALLDVLALGTCIAVFVGRWASFLSGENYGKIAPDLPWGIAFPPESHARPTGVKLHPTQLYYVALGLLLLVVLAFLYRRRLHPGRLLGLFLMLYAVGCSVIEIWRADDAARGMVIEGVLSTNQLISIPVFFAGLAILLIRRPVSEP